MKYIKLLLSLILLCCVLSSCGLQSNTRTECFGFNIADYTLVEEHDTHGSFLGDGSYYLILDCSEKTSTAQEIIDNWKPLPLTENLQLVMYGGKKDGIDYGYSFAEEAHWPIINNGVYKFVDRHSETKDNTDDTDLLDRHSFNFSIAVYDLDTDILYFFEVDT